MIAIASTIALSLFAVAMILLKLERHRKPAVAAVDSVEAVDTVAAWPPQTVRVLTLDERQAYDILRRAMPKHLVLAQVPLSRFISVPTQRSYAQWLTRVGRQSVDLLVTDTSSRPIAAIEIRSDGESARSAQRHQSLTKVLQAAGIPVYVWKEGALPTADVAYKQLRGESEAAEEERDVAKNGRRPIPVAEVHEMLAEGDNRDYGHEPVASSFFDDLDLLAPSGKS